MAYISLYRKYRSQTFDDVVGQDHVVRTIRNAIKAGRIPHGYLFCGTRGTGKTTVARLLAKALNCEHGPTPDPCNKCEACVSITNGSAVDVIEMDAASNRGIEDIREITESVRYAPMRLRYKVYIIDEAHQVTDHGKDAFLKTLEEPPAHVVFILATTEAGKIPITIRSRCQQFDFRRGTQDEITGRLKHVLQAEGIEAEEEAIDLLGRAASGSYRDSLSVLEQVMAYTEGRITAADVYAVLGIVDEDAMMELGRVLAGGDAAAALQLADRLLREGRDVRELLRSSASYFRDVLAVKVGADSLRAKDESWRAQADLYSQEKLVRVIDVFSTAEKDLKWTEQHRLGLELAFLKAMSVPDSVGTSSVAVMRSADIATSAVPAARTKPATVPKRSVPEPAAPEDVSNEADSAEAVSGAEQAAGADITLGDVTREWQAIMHRLKKGLGHVSTEAMAREGWPVSLSDGVLTIGFDSRHVWHRNKTQENAALISQAIADVLGARIAVVTASSDDLPEQTTAQDPGGTDPAKEAGQPLLDNVLNMFDGKLVEDKSDPWEA